MTKNGCSLHWGGFDRVIAKAGQKLANSQALMDSIGEALVASTVKRFADEEDPQGNKWQPSRRALAKGGRTLTDTARLRNSISRVATPDKVTWGSKAGSNVKYARIHQHGGKAGRGRSVTLPPRPFIGVSEDDKAEVQATLNDFLAGAFGVKGGKG